MKILYYFKKLQRFIYLINHSHNVILKPSLFYSVSRYNVNPILIVHMLTKFINDAKNDPTLLDETNFTGIKQIRTTS